MEQAGGAEEAGELDGKGEHHGDGTGAVACRGHGARVPPRRDAATKAEADAARAATRALQG